MCGKGDMTETWVGIYDERGLQIGERRTVQNGSVAFGPPPRTTVATYKVWTAAESGTEVGGGPVGERFTGEQGTLILRVGAEGRHEG